MIDVSGMYWESYDDQDAEDFDYVGYTDLCGKDVVVKVEDNLALQVSEIKRLNGQDTVIKVYKE